MRGLCHGSHSGPDSDQEELFDLIAQYKKPNRSL